MCGATDIPPAGKRCCRNFALMQAPPAIRAAGQLSRVARQRTCARSRSEYRQSIHLEGRFRRIHRTLILTVSHAMPCPPIPRKLPAMAECRRCDTLLQHFIPVGGFVDSICRTNLPDTPPHYRCGLFTYHCEWASPVQRPWAASLFSRVSHLRKKSGCRKNTGGRKAPAEKLPCKQNYQLTDNQQIMIQECPAVMFRKPMAGHS